tara:strand:- start:404 stop:592 length:189 start_codon:yes stop_codon:yes gene_type:complete
MDKIKNLENSCDATYSIKNNCQANFEEEDHEKTIEKVLCQHCGRTAENDIRCLGICVADNEY